MLHILNNVEKISLVMTLFSLCILNIQQTRVPVSPYRSQSEYKFHIANSYIYKISNSQLLKFHEHLVRTIYVTDVLSRKPQKKTQFFSRAVTQQKIIQSKTCNICART